MAEWLTKCECILDALWAVSKRQEARASQQCATGRGLELVSNYRNTSLRRNGRVAEGAPLLRAYTLIAYRGFESLFLRHIMIPKPLLKQGFFFLWTVLIFLSYISGYIL